MRSFANARARVTIAAIAVWLSVCAVASAQTAKERFETAQQRDEKVRVVLTSGSGTDTTPDPELLAQVSQVRSAFEAIVRRFPSSGYADNALWQSASLTETAYQRFNRVEDRDKALKLYRW